MILLVHPALVLIIAGLISRIGSTLPRQPSGSGEIRRITHWMRYGEIIFLWESLVAMIVKAVPRYLLLIGRLLYSFFHENTIQKYVWPIFSRLERSALGVSIYSNFQTGLLSDSNRMRQAKSDCITRLG